MIMKRSAGEKAFSAFNMVFMILMMVITLYPFWYVITCSFSDSAQMVGARGMMLLPKGFSLEAYKAVLKNPNILTGYRTTLIVVVFGTALNILMTAICAFLLTRRRFAIRGVMTYMALFTMYFSGGMIPTYLVIYKWYNLGDSLWALLLPGAISTYNMIIMRTNFAEIPESLEESAKIDGASEWRVFSGIVMPNVKPAWLTLIIFSVQGLWNNKAATFIYSEEKKTLVYAMQQIQSGGIARTGQGAAVLVVLMIVPIAIFIFSESQILETMASSGLKD